MVKQRNLNSLAQWHLDSVVLAELIGLFLFACLFVCFFQAPLSLFNPLLAPYLKTYHKHPKKREKRPA